MRRELIKAVIGFFFLGLILGGMYFGINYVVGKKENHEDAAVRTAWQERMSLDGKEKEYASPDVIGEAPAPHSPEKVASLGVRGRLLAEHRHLSASFVVLENEEATACADGGQPVPLAPDGGWLKADGLENVESVTLAAPGRGAAAGPVPVTGSAGRVRFNWVFGPAAESAESGAEAERLAFRDAACVESGAELKVCFHGSARFPDGTTVTVSLERGEQQWCNEDCVVTGKKFEGVLAPLEHGFPSGSYELVVQFNPLVQDPDVLEPTTNAPLVTARLAVYIGDPAREEEERAAERGEYTALYRRARAIKSAFACLRDAGLAAKGAPFALGGNLARVFKNQVPEIARDGQLDVDAWRFWIDVKMSPAVEELETKLAVRGVPGAVDANKALEGYLRTVKKMISIGSLRVYEAAGLACDVADLAAGISMSADDEDAEVAARLRALEQRLNAALKSGAGEQSKEGAEKAPFK